jgi:hypothetical protein
MEKQRLGGEMVLVVASEEIAGEQKSSHPRDLETAINSGVLRPCLINAARHYPPNPSIPANRTKVNSVHPGYSLRFFMGGGKA